MNQLQRITRTPWPVVAAAVVIAMFSVGIVMAAASSGTTTLKQMSFAQDTGIVDQAIAPQPIVPIPGMKITFNGQQHAIVRFCAEGNVKTGGGSVHVTAKVDGVKIGDRIQFFASSTALPHCYDWITGDLVKGGHEVEMFWESFGTAIGRLHDRVLTVHYKKSKP